MLFANRQEAGRRLAARLAGLGPDAETIVAGLPRGGVIVGREVADALGVPLTAIVVRKLGYPGHPELAIGAIGEAGPPVFNSSVIQGIEPAYVAKELARQKRELVRRVKEYRGGQPLRLAGKRVIIVDDGIATGATVEAAVAAAKALGATSVTVAAPVGSPESVERLRQVADEVVVLVTPEEFMAVGQFYRRFDQVTDEEVKAALASKKVHEDSEH